LGLYSLSGLGLKDFKRNFGLHTLGCLGLKGSKLDLGLRSLSGQGLKDFKRNLGLGDNKLSICGTASSKEQQQDHNRD
jgi:hypothetical protein